MANSDLTVVVGVIWNKAGDVLIAKRQSNKHCGSLWEFPGGKVEPGEPYLQALKRELNDEVGITVNNARYLFTIPYAYPERFVELLIFDVSDYEQVPFGREGQEVRWVQPSELKAYKLPPANAAIIATLNHLPTLRHATSL